MKKYWKEIILIVIAIIFFLPGGVAFFLRFDFINTDTSNDWIGFWGGYLGAIIGGLITLFVLYKTLKEEKEENKKQQKHEECKYLVERIADFLVSVDDLKRKWKRYFTFIVQGKDNLEYYEEALFSLSDVNREGLVITIHFSAFLETTEYVYAKELLQVYNSIIETLNQYNKYINTREFADFDFQKFSQDLETIGKYQDLMIQYSTKFLQTNIVGSL